MEEVREILNKGSGRNREEDKLGVMKWLTAVWHYRRCFSHLATVKRSGRIGVLPRRGEARYCLQCGTEALCISVPDALLRL